MATRFYLRRSAGGKDAPVSIAAHSNWSSGDRFGTDNQWRASTVHGSSSLFTSTNAGTAANPAEFCWFQWVTRPLDGAQSITGNISAVISCFETNVSDNALLAINAYVVSFYGTDIRGVLYDGTAGVDTEMATSAATRIRSAVAHTTVAAENWDRIVLELGVMDTGTTTNNINMTTGDTDGGFNVDYGLTSGDTTSAIPWIELSGTYTFLANEPTITNSNQLMMMGCGT